MENKIPSNSNISATVKDMQVAAATVKEASICLKVVINSISSVTDIISEDLLKNKDKLQRIATPIVSYMDIIGYITDIIAEELPGHKLNKVLGFVDEGMDPNGNVIKKAKYTCIEAVLKIGEFINAMSKTIDTISGMSFGAHKLIKLHLNIFIFKNVVSSVLKSILETLTSYDADIKEYGNFLSDNWNIVEKINKLTESSQGTTSINPMLNPMAPNNSKTNGIMFALLKTLELMSSISNIKLPSYSKFIKQLSKFKKQVSKFFGELKDLVEYLNDTLSGKSTSAVKLKSVQNKLNNSVDILESIGNVWTKITSVFNKVHFSPMIYLKLNFLFGFGVGKRGGKYRTKGILLRIFDAIIYFAESNSVKRMANRTLFKNVLEASRNISVLKRVFKSIKSIMLTGMLIALVAIPFILSIPLILLAVTGLIFTLRAINFLFKVFGSKRMVMSLTLSSARIGLVMLIIFGTIMGAVLVLAAIALMAPLILKSVIATIMVIGLIILVVLVMVGLGWLLAFMVPVLLAATASLFLVGIMMLTLILMTLMLFVISQLDISSKKEKIVQNTKDIVSTVVDITHILFDAWDDPMGQAKDSNYDDGILLTITAYAFGDTFNNLIKMILIVPIMFLAIFAVGAVIILTYMLSALYDDENDIKGSKTVTGVVDNADKIRTNVAKIMDTAKAVIGAIFGTFDTQLGTKHKKQNDQGKYVDVDDGELTTFSKEFFGDMFTNLCKMMVAAPMLLLTVISVGLVFALTWMLAQLIDGDSVRKITNGGDVAIAANITKIMDTAKAVIDAIFGVFDSPLGTATDFQDDGLLGVVCAYALGDFITNFIKFILASAMLIFTLIAIALVWLLAWSLNKIAEIKINEQAISAKVNSIMRAAYGVMDAIYRPKTDAELNSTKSEEKKGFWDKAIGLVKSVIPAGIVSSLKFLMALPTLPAVFVSVAAVSALAKSFSHVASLNTTDLVTKAQSVISSGVAVVGIINNADVEFKNPQSLFKRAQVIESVSKALAAFPSQSFDSNKHRNAVNAMIKFMGQINRTDLTKLQTTYNMLKEMKEFSRSINGNFQGLAEALEYKIAPLLNELKELLESSSKTIEKSVESFKEIKEGTPTFGASFGLGSELQNQVPLAPGHAPGQNTNSQSLQAELDKLKKDYAKLEADISKYLKNLNSCIENEGTPNASLRTTT